jgi:hypothetical protein
MLCIMFVCFSFMILALQCLHEHVEMELVLSSYKFLFLNIMGVFIFVVVSQPFKVKYEMLLQ